MSTKRKHRVAVVGCGALAQLVHLPNCAANPRIELTVVCDVDGKTAEKCRAQYGVKRAETNWRKVVEAQDVDMCILATHTNLRAEFIIPALEAGKPVYTEKPLAARRAEMLDIVRATRRTGQPVCVGHNRRSSPAILEFKRLLDKAFVTKGTPPAVDREPGRAALPEQSGTQILIRVNDDIRSWKNWIFWDEEGIIFAEMVHFIDLALWFNRAHPVRVFADGSPRGNFAIIIKFSDGSLTTLQHSMVGHFDYPKELIEATFNNITIAMDQHIEIRQCGLADEKMLRTFPYAAGCEWAKEQGMTGFMRALESEHAAAAQERRAVRWLVVEKGHAMHVDRFLDHIEGKGENPCNVDSAISATSVALKVLESIRLGLPVSISPADWHVP